MLAQGTPRFESSANMDVNTETWWWPQGISRKEQAGPRGLCWRERVKGSKGLNLQPTYAIFTSLTKSPNFYIIKYMIIYMFEIDLAHYLMSRRNLKNILKCDIGVQSTSYIFASKGTRDVYLKPNLQ